jgi:hypothetical protein
VWNRKRGINSTRRSYSKTLYSRGNRLPYRHKIYYKGLQSCSLVSFALFFCFSSCFFLFCLLVYSMYWFISGKELCGPVPRDSFCLGVYFNACSCLFDWSETLCGSHIFIFGICYEVFWFLLFIFSIVSLKRKKMLTYFDKLATHIPWTLLYIHIMLFQNYCLFWIYPCLKRKYLHALIIFCCSIEDSNDIF